MGWALRRPRSPTPVGAPPNDPAYATAIQPVLDRRCVPCHACFDSPCQLTMQSFEGLDRGGNKAVVYHPERPVQAAPTRMFQDAQPRQRGGSSSDSFRLSIARAPKISVARSVALRETARRRSPWGLLRRRPHDSVPQQRFGARSRVHDHPERGMPFGLPPLNPNEREALSAWLRRGAGRLRATPLKTRRRSGP